jgi:hypothetical protein
MYLLILGVVVIFLVLCINNIYYSDIVYAKSDIDNKLYMMRRGQTKSDDFLKESANSLAEINRRIEKLINSLEYKYSDDTSKNYFIKKLRENYNSSIISEAEIDPRYTTYTIDKSEMHICLRTRDEREKIYDIDLLMYVVLHELAHLCNYTRFGAPIQGHGLEFKKIFKFLVQEAIGLDIYEYTDYSKTPSEYCNIQLNTNILS